MSRGKTRHRTEKEKNRRSRQYDRLLVRDGGECHYCRVEMLDRTINLPMSMTKEHVIPKSFGGASDVFNYVLACRECNNLRGNQLVYCYCELCEGIRTIWFNERFEDIIRSFNDNADNSTRNQRER